MNIVELMKRVKLYPKRTPMKVQEAVNKAQKAIDNFEYEKAIRFIDKARKMPKCPDGLKRWLTYIRQILRKKVKEIKAAEKDANREE